MLFIDRNIFLVFDIISRPFVYLVIPSNEELNREKNFLNRVENNQVFKYCIVASAFRKINKKREGKEDREGNAIFIPWRLKLASRSKDN